ncbi:hypothetical protein HER39_19055 [Arthrobacter deserti]|uniref:Uncharacterized protein n=1 Tax=Arthrobacter deserti TaxID=1742687 RepID=A0ABX1JWB8_9MICC|nr:hypothetical protein [Arthrobacter deserti]
MAGEKSFPQRFMDLTGKLRMIFGPAQKSGTDHPMTEENKQLLKQREAEAAQWETVKRADGSTYIVPRRD